MHGARSNSCLQNTTRPLRSHSWVHLGSLGSRPEDESETIRGKDILGINQRLFLMNKHSFAPSFPTSCPNIAAEANEQLACSGLRPYRVSGALRSVLRLILNLPDGSQPTEPRCPVLDVKSAPLQMSGMSAARLGFTFQRRHVGPEWQQLSRFQAEHGRVRAMPPRMDRWTTKSTLIVCLRRFSKITFQVC